MFTPFPPLPTDTAAALSRKAELTNAFLPAARKAVAAEQASGTFIADPERHARTLAGYAATDMVLTGRTLLLPMDVVAAWEEAA